MLCKNYFSLNFFNFIKFLYLVSLILDIFLYHMKEYLHIYNEMLRFIK